MVQGTYPVTAADFAHAENRLLDAAFRPPVASLLYDIEEIRAFHQAHRTLLDEAPVLSLLYGRFHPLVKPWVRKYSTSPVKLWFWKDVIIESH